MTRPPTAPARKIPKENSPARDSPPPPRPVNAKGNNDPSNAPPIEAGAAVSKTR
ncbi:MAG: hypothetical protein HQM00_09545 [Magnetococcales bacterium]|nr:hypothetical protein [Magnetococcales bacterium]